MHGAGRLIYLVGPSGAGKDSLLDYVRQHRSPGDAFLVAHRYITRPAQVGGENHVALSRREFDLMRSRNCFALHWESHGNGYGIGREIDLWMQAELTVVLNGSRAYLPAAARVYPELVPVLVQVRASVLRARLEHRGRETDGEIKKRLERSRELEVDYPGLRIIDNSGSLSRAGEEFLAVIRSHAG